MKKQSIQEKILQMFIKTNVLKKLNDIEEELNELTKGIVVEADVKEVKLALLEIVMEACKEFYCTMYNKIKDGRP